MKNGQMGLTVSSKSDGQEHPMLVSDLGRYLSDLAKLHDSEKTGNPALSAGLRQVAAALRPFANCPVHDLADAIKQAKPASERKSPSRKPKVILPPNLRLLHLQEVEKILEDTRYTMDQIAELGFQRFGISRSSLKGLRKQDALNAVRAALDHELSLDAISTVARKAGNARAS